MKLVLSGFAALIVFGTSIARAQNDERVMAQPAEATEPSVPQRQGISQSREKIKWFRFGIAVYGDFAEKIKINGTDYGFGETSFTGTEYATAAPAIELSLENRFSRHWGLEYGVAYEFPRRIGSVTINEGGATASRNYDPEPSLSDVMLQVDGHFYPIRDFYILFGANLSIPTVTNSNIDLDPAVGGEVGVGYEPVHGLELEAQYRFRTASGTASGYDGTTYYSEVFTYHLDGPMILARYSF